MQYVVRFSESVALKADLLGQVAYGVALAMTDPYSDDELDSPRPDSGVIDHYLVCRYAHHRHSR